MDTKYIENIAEDFIAHKLQRGGLLVAKPKFDRDGADLIALMEIEDGAKFCRIQCKGRTLSNSNNSNVKIPKKYVTGAFFVLLYIDIGVGEPHLFCFSVEDITSFWQLKEENEDKKYYYLVISKETFSNKNHKNNFLQFTFTTEKIKEIKTNIKISISKDEIKLFSLINKQQKLIKMKDRFYKLKSLLEEHKNSKKSLKQIEYSQEILEKHFVTALSKITSSIPVKLIQEISDLLTKKIPLNDIMSQIDSRIPENIPKDMLKDYIATVMLSEGKKGVVEQISS